LALVETVDFLAEARPQLPVLASGFGHVHLLRRRLTMIMRGTTPRALTASGVVVLLAVAALLVPWLPSWGQGPAPKKEELNREILETLQKLQKVQAELQKQQAELEEQRQVVEAKARDLAKALQLKQKEKKPIFEVENKRASDEQRAKADAAQKKAATEDAIHDYERAVKILLLQQGKLRPDLEKRLAALETNLTNILKEVQNMRRELRGPQGMGAPPVKGPPQPPGGFRPPQGLPAPGGAPVPLPPQPPGAGPGGVFPQPPPGAGTGGGGFPQPPQPTPPSAEPAK
jgi:hypothetical protein